MVELSHITLPPAPASLCLLGRFFVLDADVADLAAQGFVPANPERLTRLSAVAGTFVAGYNAMFRADPFVAVEEAFNNTAPARKGFLIEGASMGAAVRDSVSLKAHWLQDLQGIYLPNYEYLMAVGAGWAMARTPWRRRAIAGRFDPVLYGLALDGRGFHDLFFAPQKAETGKIKRYSGGAARAYDTGIGRALWFVASGDINRLTQLIRNFETDRHGELLAGVGLAMAYAGPATPHDWANLRANFPNHWADVCQGIAFAAEAMRRADQSPPNTRTACTAALAANFDDVANIAVRTRPQHATLKPLGAFHDWRMQIRILLEKEGLLT